jgi:hypothetical protein
VKDIIVGDQNEHGIGVKTTKWKNEYHLKDISLLTSADRLNTMVIDMLINEKTISMADGEKLVLRFRGINSFLHGSDQLIYFEEIREYFRQNDDLALYLELIKKSDISKHHDDILNQNEIFPPIAVASSSSASQYIRR